MLNLKTSPGVGSRRNRQRNRHVCPVPGVLPNPLIDSNTLTFSWPTVCYDVAQASLKLSIIVFKFLFTYFTCTRILPAHMFLYHTCAWCLQMLEEGTGSLGLELEMDEHLSSSINLLDSSLKSRITSVHTTPVLFISLPTTFFQLSKTS